MPSSVKAVPWYPVAGDRTCKRPGIDRDERLEVVDRRGGDAVGAEDQGRRPGREDRTALRIALHPDGALLVRGRTRRRVKDGPRRGAGERGGRAVAVAVGDRVGEVIGHLGRDLGIGDLVAAVDEAGPAGRAVDLVAVVGGRGGGAVDGQGAGSAGGQRRVGDDAGGEELGVVGDGVRLQDDDALVSGGGIVPEIGGQLALALALVTVTWVVLGIVQEPTSDWPTAGPVKVTVGVLL